MCGDRRIHVSFGVHGFFVESNGMFPAIIKIPIMLSYGKASEGARTHSRYPLPSLAQGPSAARSSKQALDQNVNTGEGHGRQLFLRKKTNDLKTVRRPAGSQLPNAAPG